VGLLNLQSVSNSWPGTLDRPDILPGFLEGEPKGGWIVTVFDNDHNTVEEVIHILVVATGCAHEEASLETWEIHNLGKSVVHHGEKQECEQVAAVIAQIGIEVKVSLE
jgi:ATP-dependent Clp protease adapter protein ClpS